MSASGLWGNSATSWLGRCRAVSSSSSHWWAPWSIRPRWSWPTSRHSACRPWPPRVVLSALEELRAAGTALVLVEERAREALRLADEVVVVELGRVTWSGPAADVDLDALTSAYFGTGAPT